MLPQTRRPLPLRRMRCRPHRLEPRPSTEAVVLVGCAESCGRRSDARRGGPEPYPAYVAELVQVPGLRLSGFCRPFALRGVRGKEVARAITGAAVRRAPPACNRGNSHGVCCGAKSGGTGIRGGCPIGCGEGFSPVGAEREPFGTEDGIPGIRTDFGSAIARFRLKRGIATFAIVARGQQIRDWSPSGGGRRSCSFRRSTLNQLR